jgi:hypothetical protein
MIPPVLIVIFLGLGVGAALFSRLIEPSGDRALAFALLPIMGVLLIKLFC